MMLPGTLVPMCGPRLPARPPALRTVAARPARLALALLLLGSPAWVLGQTNLGDQRVATSSGTFLKICPDPRAAALGGTSAATIIGPPAVFTNPAAIIRHNGGTEFYASYMNWPADIQITGAALSRSLPSLDAQVAAGFLFLGTTLEETTEYAPEGTGRSVSYSDLLASVSFSRYFTDKLAIGLTLKYLHEDLGSSAGGPTIGGWLVDAGTMYNLGYRNARMAIALTHFGPDLRPGGSFHSQVSGTDIRYSAFSPPTQFQLGLCIDPYESGPHRLTTAIQIQHQADKQETLRGGVEYWLKNSYALRTGYDFASDEMAFSAGLGLKVELGDRPATFDYAYTEGGHLQAVHRWALGLGF